MPIACSPDHGEVVDFDAIKDDLREFYGRFDVQEVAYDPWQATQLAQEMEKKVW